IHTSGRWRPKFDRNLTETRGPRAIESLLIRRKSMPRPLLAVAALFGALLSVPWMCAQSTFGSIIGSAKDASGAAVPEAIVKLRELDKNITQTTVSNDEGLYELLDLKRTS